MRRIKGYFQQVISYEWEYYSELAGQRKAVWSQLKEAILENVTEDFEFREWHRAVKWKYSNHPLCTLGSLSDPGGRFNLGDLNPELVPKFSALYLAVDRPTAEQELLGQNNVGDEDGLSFYERALINKDSVSVVTVNGILDSVFDLRQPTKLKKMCRILKKFKLSKGLKEKARKLDMPPPSLITSARQLQDSFLELRWRFRPMRFDIPSNPQIFGQIVKESGVTGILYPSKMTGKDCLAIFSDNFKNSAVSFVELRDAPPDANTPKKIDRTNYGLFETRFSDIK